MKKHIIISCFAVMAILAGSFDFAEAREHRGDKHRPPHHIEQKFHHKKHHPHFMHRPKPMPHKPAFRPNHYHDTGINLSLRLDNGYIRFGAIN